MGLPVRNSIKILLLNDKNEILLMCANDPKTVSENGKYYGRFWFPIGGKIEKGEDLFEAAIREIYEETGLKREEIELGPIVWFGEFNLKLHGILTKLKEKFIVVKTKKNKVSLTNLDDWEKKVVEEIAWFSLEKIKNSKEVIFPILLEKYLPDIILKKYPKKPIKIDLAKQPEKYSIYR